MEIDTYVVQPLHEWLDTRSFVEICKLANITWKRRYIMTKVISLCGG